MAFCYVFLQYTFHWKSRFCPEKFVWKTCTNPAYRYYYLKLLIDGRCIQFENRAVCLSKTEFLKVLLYFLILSSISKLKHVNAISDTAVLNIKDAKNGVSELLPTLHKLVWAKSYCFNWDKRIELSSIKSNFGSSD